MFWESMFSKPDMMLSGVILILQQFVGFSQRSCEAKEAELIIGAEHADAQQHGLPTKGIIDDVGLFNTALNEEQINKIMNEGLLKSCSVTPVDSKVGLPTTWAHIKKSLPSR